MASVVSVTGEIAADALGFVLPHEHILCDLTPLALRGPGDEVEITLSNRFEVDYRPTEHRGNHRLTSRQVAADELRLFAASGGGTIVELTVAGMNPDPAGLRSLSIETGVPIIMGAGFYTSDFVDDQVRSCGVDELADAIETQLRSGVAGSPVRAGLIGEIGCSWPLAPFEHRCLQAAARAQARTGAPIHVHPGRHPEAPHQILDILQAEGAALHRVAIDHIDRTLFDLDSMIRLARRRVWLEFDFFGIETSNYWFGDADLPGDAQRLRYLAGLAEHGFGERLLLSHDICTRTRLCHWGGHGYGHLPRNVVQLMRRRGFTEDDIQRLTRRNPRHFLAGDRDAGD